MMATKIEGEGRISQSAVERYKEDGYILHDEPILSLDEVAEVLDKLVPIVAGDSTFPADHIGAEEADAPVGPDNPARKITGLSYHVPFFERMAKSPVIVDKVSSLIGPDIKLYTDEFFMKNPAREGESFAGYIWHQDAVNYDFFAPLDGFVTCWIALDEARIENGCMHMIPRSHTLGPIARTGRQRFVDHPCVAEPVAAEVKPGYAVFHDGLNFHCSYPNQSALPRRAIAFHYMRAETRYLGIEDKRLRDYVEHNRVSVPFRFMQIRGQEFADSV
jgi:phytanoyl-CoA hydroxylase